MCEENSAWDSFFVAGAVFGEVGGRCLLLQVFQQETLSSSNTDVIFLGSIDIIIRRDKNEHHASAMDQLKGFRTFAMRTLLRAAHCLRRIQQHEHFVSLAVRAPLWAAHCRVASDCPSPSLPCNA